MKRALGMLLLTAGCAAQTSSGPPTDGGVSDCALSLSAPPAQPVAGEPLRLEAEVDAAGFRSHTWRVRFEEEDDPLPVESAASDGSAVRFTPARAGYYRVRVEGSVEDAACTPDEATLNVLAPGAVWERYVLRARPGPAHPAPIQAVARDVPGGGNYLLGAHVLERGTEVSGTVRGPGGAPLAGAYLRAARVAGGPALEIQGHADATGGFDLHLPGGSWELLVVPQQPGAAPWRRGASSADAIPSVLEVPAPVTVSGSVAGPGGAPVEGARVALKVDGVPSSLGVTDAAGEVTLEARPGEGLSLSITPPAGSGLPRLEVEGASVPVAGGSAFAAQYDAGLDARTESFTVVGADGATPVGAGARATFLAEIPSAGAVSVDGGAALEAVGSVRAAATTDSGGALGPIALPAAAYEVALEAPVGTGAALIPVDLSAGEDAPSSLTLRETATVIGRVVDAAGEPVAGARVRAAPTGPLAGIAAAGACAGTDADGRFALSVAAGGPYELEVEPRRRAPLRLEMTGPAPGTELDLGERSLPPAVRLFGTLEITGVGGGAEGVHLTARCAACDRNRPVAETLTGPGGTFKLPLPDPGSRSLHPGHRNNTFSSVE